MSARPARDGELWTREELIPTFELYCRIPFQQTKATDARVKRLAALLQRTPGSVARKLGNFGALDPSLAVEGISGLTHMSNLDRTIWNEFQSDWNRLVAESQSLIGEFEQASFIEEPLTAPSGPSERAAGAKQRRHQTFFRDAVVSSYNQRCCITGIPIAQCLVASHIIPWSVSEVRRADPTNGLCLSATFDKLFENGLIAIKDDLTLQISKQVLRLRDKSVVERIALFDGNAIIPPSRFMPDPMCLRWHRENVFQAA